MRGIGEIQAYDESYLNYLEVGHDGATDLRPAQWLTESTRGLA
jgi:hypothetical protein